MSPATAPLEIDDARSPSGHPAHAVGARLRHVAHGDEAGSPVLFLHGITGSLHYWDRALVLARGRRLFFADLMGFGDSPKPQLRYDMPAYVASMRGFVASRGLAEAPLDVVAHSLGGLIALAYALEFPGHLRRVVLLSLPCYADRAEAHELFLAGSGNYRRLLGKASARATFASWRRAGWAMALRYAFAFSPRIAADSRRWTFHSLTSTIEHCLLGHRVQRAAPSLAQLPETQRPELLLVHGERDQVAPVGRVEELAPLLPAAKLHVLAGTGHHPFRTHAGTCLSLIDAFLSPDPRS